MSMDLNPKIHIQTLFQAKLSWQSMVDPAVSQQRSQHPKVCFPYFTNAALQTVKCSSIFLQA